MYHFAVQTFLQANQIYTLHSNRQIGSISQVALKVLISCSLGPLVSKVKEYQVETIVDTLCTNMLSDKEQLRDISSIGLKTVIGELPPASSGKTRFPCVIIILLQLFFPNCVFFSIS